MTALFPSQLIFDWDNTLVDTSNTLDICMKEAIERAGLDYMVYFERFKKIGFVSTRQLFPMLFNERSEEVRTYYYEAYAREHCKTLRPFEGVIAMLELLKAQDFIISIISNKMHYYLENEIKALHWQQYFDGFVGAGESKKDKPDFSHLELYCERFGFDVRMRNQFCYIGDSEVDLEFAFNTSMISVLIAHQDSQVEHLPMRFTPDHYVMHPLQIPKLFQ